MANIGTHGMDQHATGTRPAHEHEAGALHDQHKGKTGHAGLAHVPSLRVASGFGTKANVAPRAAVLHTMQQTHGNRAVQRCLQGRTASRPIAVQRQAAQPGPVADEPQAAPTGQAPAQTGGDPVQEAQAYLGVANSFLNNAQAMFTENANQAQLIAVASQLDGAAAIVQSTPSIPEPHDRQLSKAGIFLSTLVPRVQAQAGQLEDLDGVREAVINIAGTVAGISAGLQGAGSKPGGGGGASKGGGMQRRAGKGARDITPDL